MDSLTLILNTFKTVFSIFFSMWWLYLPILLFFLALTAYKNFINLRYLLSLNWVLLEIKPPKEVRKSPKAMEQVFAGLHGAFASNPDFKDKYIDGRVLTWFSFELVGKGGETHFYIRTTDKFKNMVESQIYAQYPEAEISEVADYVNDLPLYLPDEKYDLWGTDLMLAKPDAYPIRTYPEFEEKSSSPDDVKRIDPMASLAELFSTLQPNEQIWVQILGAPVGGEWIKKGQAEIDKLMGKKPSPAKVGLISDMVFAIDRAISGIGSAPAEQKEEKRADLSPGKQEILKVIEKSWDKPGYASVVRYLYIGPKDNMRSALGYGVSGSFRQFASQNLNSFKVNKFTLTYAKSYWLFKKSRLLLRKKAIFQSYRERRLFNPAVVSYTLNIEELATIYHFPDVGVKSPLLPRVEFKKGEPPAGLPII